MSLFRNPFKKGKKPVTIVKQPTVDPNTIAGCFVSHFIMITGLLSNSQFANSPVMIDLFAAMLTTTEFISTYYDIDIDDDRNEIIKWFLSSFSNLPQNEFKELAKKVDDRLDFYRSRATTGAIRGDSLLYNISDAKRKWPPYRYSVIFCDCIYNSECLGDYDGAPVRIDSYFESVNQIPLFETIIQQFDHYTKEIKSYGMD